jgi:hypothetical protein|tara:strand:+ start:306 stop:515 length:210 start_codon:yes stop_codon:yes gene_type:complete
MSELLNEENKEFLTMVFNESIQQIRTKSLGKTSQEDLTELVKNITHIREIAEKLDLKNITPKLKYSVKN